MNSLLFSSDTLSYSIKPKDKTPTLLVFPNTRTSAENKTSFNINDIISDNLLQQQNKTKEIIAVFVTK